MSFEVFTDKFEAFVGVNFWTMIFAWINILILYFILKKLVFKRVKGMIDSRQQEIDDIYSGAESARSEAEAMRTEYEDKLQSANEESEQILRSAVRRAQLREEEILREADEQATRAIRRAEEQIELERRRALNEIKNEVSDMAISIASAVIERDVSQEEHSELIDAFIKDVGDSQ